MKLRVVSPAVFASEEEARRKLWIYLKSCEKFGIEPHLYGIGTPQFPGYRKLCHDMQLDYLKALPTDISHILYTESWDAFFTGPLEEITAKYEAMGSPQMLMAAFHQLANVSDPTRYDHLFDHSIRYRYPQVGGYIAEREYLIYAMERMNHETGDNCFLHYDAWKEGWYRPMLDSDCEIFQVGDEDLGTAIRWGSFSDQRLLNTHTLSTPCILHLSGGYTSSETGKDARLIPWARRLGIID